MQQLKNFLSKREQSQARLRFAECEKSRLKAKLMITLALLMTAAAGAWATDYTTLAVGDVIKVGDTFSPTAESQGGFNGISVNSGKTYTLIRADVDNEYYVTEKTDGAYYVFKFDTDMYPYMHFQKAFAVTAISDGLEVTNIETKKGKLYYTLALHESVVTPTGNANEWSMVMPAGNVLLTVAYKDRATMALTYGGTAITAEANAVTVFKGCEQEFAEALTPAVQNIEPTFNSGTAQDVTTTLAADFTFKSSDAAIIGFKSGETYADEGTLDQMEFRALTTSPVTLTVTYKGTDDLESKSQTLLVTIEKKTYSVSLADNTEDADSWKGNVNDAETDVNLPITKLDEGDAVTLKYNGRLKVKSVTATIDAKPDPLTVPLTIEAITAGSINVKNLKEGMQYSLNGGAKTAVTADDIALNAGDKVQFYGDGTNITKYGDPEMAKCTMIKGSGDDFTCKVYGNIMSLLDEENFATSTTLSDSYTFRFLFSQNPTLTDASGLLLPATKLQESCYMLMFNACIALTAAPALPATELAASCYRSMFDGCSALTAAPVLPATKLVNYCYHSMFNNCKKLATVTCLATSGIAQDSSTFNWIQYAGSEVQGTKTVNTVSTAEWPSDISGIPTGWTRVNIDN